MVTRAFSNYVLMSVKNTVTGSDAIDFLFLPVNRFSIPFSLLPHCRLRVLRVDEFELEELT